MSKKKNELATVQSTELSVKPEWMNDAPLGTENMDHYIRPPVLKLIQKSASSEYLSQFSPGSLIVNPMKELLVGLEEKFSFTPIMFYPEWLTFNPLALNDLPMIHERSLSPTSRIATLAKSPATWYEDIPGRVNPKTQQPYRRQHIECLNFVMMVHGFDFIAETAVVLTCSKTRWKDGSKLLSLIRARKAPIYGCIFEGATDTRTNSEGEFYGFTFKNPSEGPAFVENEAQFKVYQDLHALFTEKLESISIDHGDAGEAAGPVTDM